MIRLGLVLLLVSTSLGAAPQLRVQAQLPEGGQAVVGQTLPLQVDVLTDSWFTSAPQLPTLSLPGVVVTPPGDRAQHLTLNLDGTPFFGMRYVYRLTAQQAGALTLPALTVSAQPGNATALLSAQTQPLPLDITWPAGVPAGQTVLVASAVRLEQTVDSRDGLKAGDSLVRTVTLHADDSLPMLLPVTPLAEVDGLSRLLKTPQLSASGNGGQRIDSASYRIERAGDFRLPAIRVQWWSLRDRTLHSAELPAVDFSASAAPVTATPFPVTEDLRRLGREGQWQLSRHWFAALGLALVALLAGLLVRRFAPTAWRRYRHWREAREARWQASAEYAWRQVPGQLGQHPPQLGALYLWWRRRSGALALGSADTSTQALLQQCYAASGQAQAPLPDLTTLHRRVAPKRQHDAGHALRPLNPTPHRTSP